MTNSENPTREPRSSMRQIAINIVLVFGLLVSTYLLGVKEGANRSPSPTRPQATPMAVISPSIGGDTENPVVEGTATPMAVIPSSIGGDTENPVVEGTATPSSTAIPDKAEVHEQEIVRQISEFMIPAALGFVKAAGLEADPYRNIFINQSRNPEGNIQGEVYVPITDNKGNQYAIVQFQMKGIDFGDGGVTYALVKNETGKPLLVDYANGPQEANQSAGRSPEVRRIKVESNGGESSRPSEVRVTSSVPVSSIDNANPSDQSQTIETNQYIEIKPPHPISPADLLKDLLDRGIIQIKIPSEYEAYRDVVLQKIERSALFSQSELSFWDQEITPQFNFTKGTDFISWIRNFVKGYESYGVKFIIDEEGFSDYLQGIHQDIKSATIPN